MKVDSENLIKLQNTSAKSNCFTETAANKMNSLETESTTNRKIASGCDCNAVEDKLEGMPNNSSSHDAEISNTKLKSEELENSNSSPYDSTISNVELKSTEEMQNGSSDLFDTSNSSATLYCNLEGANEDSLEEIIEITLSDYDSDEQNADACSYSSSLEDVNESSGLPCSETGTKEVVNTCLDSEESQHLPVKNAVTDRDGKRTENNQLTNPGAADKSSNGDADTTENLTVPPVTLVTLKPAVSDIGHRKACGGTEKQFLIEEDSNVERSGSLKDGFGEQQDVSSDNSNVSSVEEKGNEVLADSSRKRNTISDTENTETEVLDNSNLELDKPCLITSEVVSSQPQKIGHDSKSEHGSKMTGSESNEKSITNLQNCGTVSDLEGRQNKDEVNCFNNVITSTCEMNKAVPPAKGEQTDVIANEESTSSQSLSTISPSVKTIENPSKIATTNVLSSKIIDKESVLVSQSTSVLPGKSSCFQYILPNSFKLNATENLTVPPVTLVTLKPAVSEIEPVSGTVENVTKTFSVCPLTPAIKLNSSSTVSLNSITQEKSKPPQPVLVYQPFSTEKTIESPSGNYTASNMMVKLSGSLLARAQDLKLPKHVQSNLRRVCSLTEESANQSKTCTKQSDQLACLSQCEPKSASSRLTGELAPSGAISSSSSTNVNQTTHKTDDNNSKPDSVRPEPSRKKVDSITDTAKNIKSEPVDDGYEKSSQSSLENADLIKQGKIKTEPKTMSDEGTNKDPATLKSSTKPIALLPKVPIAFVNQGGKNPNVVCSYIIPINTTVASSTYFQTLVKSVSNVKKTIKKVTLKSGCKTVKTKVQQLRPICSKKAVVTGAETQSTQSTTSTSMPNNSDSRTEIPSSPADFRIKSLDIANISELVQRKNLEQLYKPPDPPASLKCANKRSLCTECGDQFLLESSLRDHFQRLSMVIQYFCKPCNAKLLFTNKCSLLKHLRCHTSSLILSKTALQISADNISVLSLLDGNMPKTEQPTVHVVNSITSVKTPCPECGQETHLKMSHHFGSLGVICNFKHMCKNCSMYLPTACSLRAHSRIHYNMQPLVCPECGVTFHDHDAFKTHLYVDCYHFHRTPVFVCPMCRVLVPKAISLEQHFVLEHKNIYYTDKTCKTNFLTYEQWLDHRKTDHGEHASSYQVNFYCQICKTGLLMKFLLNHMHSHMSAMKQNVPFGYICITCRDEYKISKIFISKNILLNHMELHKAGRNHHCPECSESFGTDSELDEHISKYHTSKDLDVCQYCSLSVRNVLKHHKHCVAKNVASMFKKHTVPISPRHQKAPKSKEFLSFLNILNQNACSVKLTVPESVKEDNLSGFMCRFCKLGFISFQQFTKHIASHVKDGVLICNKCQRRNFKSVGELKSHQIVCGLILTYQDSVAAEEEFRCEECEKYFRDSTALQRHVREEHAFHPCHLCGLTYSTSEDLEQHVNTIHRGRKSITLSCQLCKGKKGKGKTFMRREFYYNHMATVHGISKPDEEGNDSKRKIEMAGSGSPLKRLKVSDCDQYCCAKCNFSTEKSEEFSEHIAKHKKDSSSVQCPNCGLCFRVVPALKGHLFLVHKIKDVEQFIVDKGLQVPEEEEDVDVGSVGAVDSGISSESQNKHQSSEQVSDNPRECCVCKRIFETEAEKNFHMRTHGMAFISSRRRQRPKQESDGSDVDVKSQPNIAATTPEKSSTTNSQDGSKPSPISVAKRIKLSEKDKILQPANQPVVAIERIPSPEHIQKCPVPDQTVSADEKSSTETK